jgi:hypothetical protein
MNKKRRLRLQAHRPRADGPGTTADGTVSRGFMLSFHVTFVSAERGLGRSVRQFGQAALIGLCSYCAFSASVLSFGPSRYVAFSILTGGCEADSKPLKECKY